MGLRLSAAGIFLLGAAGLLLHSTLLETGHIRPGMFCFYTNLSNLLVLVYELALAAVPEGAVRRLLTGSGVALSMTLCIYVTHLIYHFVLVPDARRRGKKFADFGGSFGNLCVHYGTPWLVVGQWLLWGNKAGLTAASTHCCIGSTHSWESDKTSIRIAHTLSTLVFRYFTTLPRRFPVSPARPLTSPGKYVIYNVTG